jgi:hypothetical protein
MNTDRLPLPASIQDQAKVLFREAFNDPESEANATLWALITEAMPETGGKDWYLGYAADLTTLTLAPCPEGEEDPEEDEDQ